MVHLVGKLFVEAIEVCGNNQNGTRYLRFSFILRKQEHELGGEVTEQYAMTKVTFVYVYAESRVPYGRVFVRNARLALVHSP